ncbi:unnamed protein product [Rhizophagus irregularis]|nr:unnamed protein product [Rhizophagus irregularis]
MEVGDDDDGNEQDSENEVLPTVESFKGSIVWIHFTKDPDFKENKKATCKYCSKVYVCSGGSTSNLKKHLKKHNIQMNQNHGQDIREMFSSSKGKTCPMGYNESTTFTIVEEPSFIEFVHSLHPGALIPSADTIKRNIYNLYEVNVKKIKDILQMVPGKISFTTDIWTSPSTKSFLSLTAHFIDKEWKLRSVIVDFIQMYGSHTGENIKNTFISGLENLSIEDKLFGITLDNASNNQVFINELSKWADQNHIIFNSENHFRCFAHTINIGVQEFLKYLDQELSLSQLRQLLNKIHVPTRWNSTCEMISRALLIKPALDITAISDRDLKSYTLTEEQWNGLRKIVDFLEPFKEVTAVILGSTYSTLSMMIPLFNFLIDHVEDIIGDENEEVNEENDDENDDENIRIEKSIKKAAKYCKDKLLKYYVKTNNAYSIAVILDPRLKIQYFKDEEWGDDLINEINQNFVNIFNSNYATTSLNSNISSTSKEKSVMSRVFKRRYVGNIDEFKTYIASPTVSGETLDPLEWWRINETQYPQLKTV